jgi:hypothetical protein
MLEVKFDKNTFNIQRQLWQESNIVKYKFQYGGNFGIGEDDFEETIIVENGRNSPNLTIDKIYEDIEIMFNQANNKEPSIKLNKIAVKYDEVNHIPIKIKYYYNNNYRTPFIDRTFYFIISDFEKIN